MIRVATVKDKYDIMILARNFHKDSGYRMEFSSDKFLSLFDFMVGDTNHCVLVYERGGRVQGFLFGMVSYPHFSDDLIANELGWFVSKEYRGSLSSLKLVLEYEKWAISKGCSFISMSSIEGLSNTDKIYSRLGYNLAERSYIKEI